MSMIRFETFKVTAMHVRLLAGRKIRVVFHRNQLSSEGPHAVRVDPS